MAVTIWQAARGRRVPESEDYRQLPKVRFGMRYVFLLLIVSYIVSGVFDLGLHVQPILIFVAAFVILSLWQIVRTAMFFRRHPLRNFPCRHVVGVKKAWLRIGVVFLIAVLMVVVSAYMFRLMWFHDRFAVLSGLVLFFSSLVLFCLMLMYPGGIPETVEVRILPYFKERVGNTETFLYGQGIARRVVLLDALAEKLGLSPISAFGYNDNFLGEDVTWHDAEDGLKTVSGLLDHLRGNPRLMDDADRIIRDLTRTETALREAHGKSIQFCFLAREGSTTSGLEMDRREGTFF
ncbi:MAG: hypothetical protein ACE5HN_02930 [Nitrospiria bacterium]